jgi:hypothetical protein
MTLAKAISIAVGIVAVACAGLVLCARLGPLGGMILVASTAFAAWCVERRA